MSREESHAHLQTDTRCQTPSLPQLATWRAFKCYPLSLLGPTWNQARPNHIQGLLARIRSSPQSSGQIPLGGQVIEQPPEFLAATTHTFPARSLNEYLLFFPPRILPQHYSYSQLLRHLASRLHGVGTWGVSAGWMCWLTSVINSNAISQISVPEGNESTMLTVGSNFRGH